MEHMVYPFFPMRALVPGRSDVGRSGWEVVLEKLIRRLPRVGWITSLIQWEYVLGFLVPVFWDR